MELLEPGGIGGQGTPATPGGIWTDGTPGWIGTIDVIGTPGRLGMISQLNILNLFLIILLWIIDEVKGLIQNYMFVKDEG